MHGVPEPWQRGVGPVDAEVEPAVAASRRRSRRAAGPWRRQVERVLAGSGVTVDGRAPWDIRVHDRRFYRRCLTHGSLGLGEAFVDGWWDTADLDGCLERLLRHRAERRAGLALRALLGARHALLNLQRGAGAWLVGRQHYDLGDDVFAAMLGRRMVYSCAYWAEATDLDTAQLAKLDLVCRKLELEPGMRVLDIGCGWGEALKYAAERYGVEGVGLTISKNQAATAAQLCAGLPVEIRLADYRSLGGERYDRVFSIGMFEHVGPRNHAAFFDVVQRSLQPQGLALLHTIGTHTGGRVPDPWIERYVFPNSVIPCFDDVVAAATRHFAVEDVHNFGLDYVRTLAAWRTRFDAAWPRLSTTHGEPFHRLWHYYLAASIASFRARRNHLWQFVLAPHGRDRVYRGRR